MSLNLHGIRAIYRFEIARTLRTITQSLIAPVLTTSLYFIVFGTAIGATALAADVRLTARQAFEGAAMPLDVPVRCTCRACGGRGERWPDVCAACGGSGIELRTHAVRVLVPARVRDGARFRFVVAPRQHPVTRIELRVSVA